MKFEDAKWVGPTPNKTTGAMHKEIKGLVLHITAGLMPGVQSWLKNPVSEASAHFINPKVGQLLQLVDTEDKAWAEGAGNPDWISIENEGLEGDALTDSQIDNAAALLRWLYMHYSVPVKITDSVGIGGLGWHGMGGAAWGGHPHCPGDKIKAQRDEIIKRAKNSHINEVKGDAVALRNPLVAFQPTKDGNGYYMLLADGAIITDEGGFAQMYGGRGGDQVENAPFVGMGLTKTGKGYWLVGADGAVFSYGDAAFYGSLGAQHLNAPVVAFGATASGEGYWMAAADGGVFAFGDAPFRGAAVNHTA